MFTEEEEMMRDAVSRFAQDVVAPRVRSMDERAVMDTEVIEGMHANGLLGVEIAEEYGGGGFGFTAALIVVEELAKVDASVSVLCDIQVWWLCVRSRNRTLSARSPVHSVRTHLSFASTRACAQNTLINNTFSFWGSDALKKRYLPRLATDTVGSFCLSEAGSGSDAFAMSMRAELSDDGSEYILNGEKLWISNSVEAGIFVVFANADPSKAHRGITCFVVDRAEHGAGLTVGKKEDKLGLRASSTCPVTFEDVRVPADHVLGEVGDGYKYAIGILNEGRIGIAAQMVGVAQGCFDATMPYLWQRKQFGTLIGDFQGMQHQLAQVATEIEAARVMVYVAACRTATTRQRDPPLRTSSRSPDSLSPSFPTRTSPSPLPSLPRSLPPGTTRRG